MKLLLDEHIWPGLAAMVQKRLPGTQAESLHEFSCGRFINCEDGMILREAHQSGYTLATFDVNTIPAVLQEMAEAQENHSGVIFISSKSFAQNDHQGVANALVALIEADPDAVWMNRVVFLRKCEAVK